MQNAGPASRGKGADWAAIAQRLIGAGHCAALIGDYTLPQIEAFMAAVDTEERQRDRVSLILARAATAEAKQFQKIVKGLSDGQ
ncbi:hypothetical protein [Pseudomonas sp.]|uniref:hypothetical protein n=1 Tax=Pseudomonas sp. TaxID=306 RepID=UPI0040542AC1